MHIRKHKMIGRLLNGKEGLVAGIFKELTRQLFRVLSTWRVVCRHWEATRANASGGICIAGNTDLQNTTNILRVLLTCM
jgi:hypothetical protein